MNSNNGGYSPYMFGNSYGAGFGSESASNNTNMCAGQSTRRDAYNVRDCMYWPASLGVNGQRSYVNPAPPITGGRGNFNMGDQYYPQAAQITPMSGGNGNFGSSDPYTFHTGMTNDYGTGEPMQPMPQQAPIKAYMSTPTEGGALGKPIQIPCHMGAGPGKVPAIPSMPPLGYKVMVPQIPPTPPVDFEIRQ